jgi:hypothetical protein
MHKKATTFDNYVLAIMETDFVCSANWILDVQGVSPSVVDLIQALKKEKESFGDLGIDIEEKAFYDILKGLAYKYEFEYPEKNWSPWPGK